MFANSNQIFTVLLGCVAVKISHEQYFSSDEEKQGTRLETRIMPPDWPDQWNDGIIPFVYDYFSANPKSFIKIVHKGHDFMKQNACLRFQERNPIALAQIENYTYLYYSYSGVLEECCGTFFSKPVGRRMVLITPKCRAPAEVAHATLHALGLTHEKNQRFLQSSVQAVLYPEECMSIAITHHHSGVLDPVSSSVEHLD